MVNPLVPVVEVASVSAAISALCYSAEGLASYVSYRLLIGSFRELHTFSRDMVYASVYLPTASAFAAVISSIGTNLLTSGSRSAQVNGAIMAVAGLVVLAYAGLLVARRYSRTRGVARIRMVLHAAGSSPPTNLAELDATIAKLERVRRVGARVCRGPGRISFITWIRREGRTFSLVVLSLCHLVTLSFAALTLYALVHKVNSRQAAVVAVALVLSAVLYYGGLLVSWQSHRRTFTALGTEFSQAAGNVLPRLHALRAQASQASPSTRNVYLTSRLEGLAALVRDARRFLWG